MLMPKGKKMRLIDADALVKDKIVDGEVIDGNVHDLGYWGYCVFYETIEAQPTIEAIPVKWIKAWKDRSENTYYRDQVISMMKDWRKEHETD